MGNAWQSWLVLALVVLAAAYSIWYWLPASLRKSLGAVHQALGKRPTCSSCSSCGKCATPAAPRQAGQPDLPAGTQPITFHRQR